MLVEFASVVDAVTCAVAVQGKMTERNEVTEPKITFRIGINIGDIIIDGDDIFGDGVNVAARVEGECEPDMMKSPITTIRRGPCLHSVEGACTLAYEQRVQRNDQPPMNIPVGSFLFNTLCACPFRQLG